jgi:hypothetical protein
MSPALAGLLAAEKKFSVFRRPISNENHGDSFASAERNYNGFERA